jgi:hypothetical protein
VFSDQRVEEPGSSVGIVPAYGLDDRAFEVLSAAEAKEFFLLFNGHRGSPGVKYCRGVTLTTHPL